MKARNQITRARRRRSRWPRRRWLVALGVVGSAAIAIVLIAAHALLSRGVDVRVTPLDLAVEARALGISSTGAAQPVLFDSVLTRKLLAREARRRGFDRQPQSASVRTRAVELALSKELVASLPPPRSPRAEAVDAYIATHADEFAERRRWFVDALAIPLSSAAPTTGLKWDDIVRRLASANVAAADRPSVLLSSEISPALRAALERSVPDGVITVTDGGKVTLYRVISSEPAALGGDAARVAAREALYRAEREVQPRGPHPLRGRLVRLRSPGIG